MLLTFNELSAKTTSISSQYDAQQLILEFATFCQKLNKTNAIDDIIFPSDFYSIALYDGYGLSQWLFDKNVSQQHRQFLKRFLDKYRNSFDRNSTEGEFSVSIDGEVHNSIGCAFALERDHTLLSLATHDFWKSNSIAGNYSFINQDEEFQIESRTIDNVSTITPDSDVVNFQRERILEGISSGQDLWEAREKLYPNLVLCDNVKDQLYHDSEKTHIFAVMKRLQHLQNYFSQHHESYNPDELGFDARTESESVKTNPKLRNDRKFRLPDGTEEYFFDHIGFTGKYKGGRIYFLPDCKNQRCYIGYVGQHLSTQKF